VHLQTTESKADLVGFTQRELLAIEKIAHGADVLHQARHSRLRLIPTCVGPLPCSGGALSGDRPK
jgi:hypothetical protein